MDFDGTKRFFHVDLDAFFASVEQLVHPEWKGKPVIVGGLPGDRRAVVSTASYEARKFGVHSAMPLARAVDLCPDGIFTRGNRALYEEYSQRIMAIFSEYSPDVRQISIDEAFLDMTGTERLFGGAIDCAKKLKADVFKKTGLTVSVGIATTHYLAKIASGLQKPDGLFAVLPGEEEKFMLSLPLEKVWGVGPKTLERLRAAGFYSTRDIRSHSKELLSGVFGAATAEFLFNVVRGLEPPGFLEEPKSRSSGIESTYDYDLADWPSIEGALLELSERLMFRLLRENVTGKTVSVKIRYDDFSTVSAQSAGSQNVTSVEDLFSRAAGVFRAKYQAGRPVRLLGITVNNTVSADSEKQNELFDFGEKKRKAMEKAILNIERKNPGVKIHKARLLKNGGADGQKKEPPSGGGKKAPALLLALFAALSFRSPKLFADDTATIEASGSGPLVVGKDLPPETEPPGTKILDWNVRDKSVEFIAQGYWDAKLKQTMTATFGRGKAFSFSAAPPVFVQQVDMSLWFLLDKHWYLEAAFADEFNKNTFAAGYKDGSGYLNELRAANRNVVFPDRYSVSDVNRGIGGGENQAPGVSAALSDPDGKWTFDAAFRYDMLVSRDKTYYGKNSVNDTNKAKSDFLTGRMFVFPSFEVAASVQDVYVENPDGGWSDGAGRKYKKLSESDYLVVPSRKMLVLSALAGAAKTGGILPAVAVSFDGAAASARCLSELGNFGTNELAGAGSGFLGNVQKAFGFKDGGGECSALSPNVASFSYCGKSGQNPCPDPSGAAPASIDGCGFFGTIDGKTVLFVQHPAGFSPFTVCFRYDFGLSSVDEIMVVHSQSGSPSPRYAAIPADDDLALTEENYFLERRYCADVYDALSDKSDYAEARVRFPFCESSPGSYLGYSDTDDLLVRARNYASVSRFDIGTDAISGTVIVYKNGTIDSGAKYNPETGEVSLSSGVGSNDKIYIVWYEDSKSFDSGSVALAAGFNYNWTEKLSGDASFAGRWTLSPTAKYAEAGKASFGYGTLASRIKFEDERWTLQNTISGTVENKNATGFFKVLGFNDEAASTSYNSQSAGKALPSGFAPRLNPRPSEPASAAVELDSAYDRTLSVQEGISDGEISGYKIPLSWNWSGSASEWAAETIEIAGAALPSASTFSVALKMERGFSGDVYLQLGVNADEEFEAEAKGAVPTWKISDAGADGVLSALDASATGWQIVKLALEDSDRAKCVQYKNARVVAANVSAETGNGTIYFGPYEIAAKGVFTVQDDAFLLTAAQVRAANPGAGRFNSSANYAEEISWKSESAAAPDDPCITIYKYFEESDHADYNEINMYFRFQYDGSESKAAADSDWGLSLLLDADAESAVADGKIAARANISKAALAPFGDGLWHLLAIDKSGRRVKIDGAALDASACSFQINNSVVPSRVKIRFNTSGQDWWNESGTFWIDELYFSETSPHFLVQDKNSVNWKKDGVLLESKNGFPIISDARVRAASQENASFYTEKYRSSDFDASADASAGATFGKIAVEASLARTAGSERAVSNASHSLSTAAPLFGSLSFGEEYSFDGEEKSAAKSNFLAVDFKPLGLPLLYKANVKADSGAWSLNSKAENSLSLKLGTNSLGWAMKLSTESSEKLLRSSGGLLKTENYFATWLSATQKEFTFGDSAAAKRKVGAKIENTIYLPVSSLAPSVAFSAEENYSASKNYYYSDKSALSLAFPFKAGKNSFSLSWKKTGGGVKKTEAGGDYAADIKSLASSYSGRDYFFYAAPVYDLISQNLAEKVHKKTRGLSEGDSLESEWYNAEYSFTFKRPIFADKRDFYVPSNASLSFARDIRAAQSVSDTNQARLRLGWTAFNIFGKNGSIPVARWFEQDEYISSFSATLKIPRDNPRGLTQVYTAYFQANFYIKKGSVLKSGAELNFQDEKNFSAKATASWKRPGKASPVSALAKLLFKKARENDIPITRSDSLNCSWKSASSLNSGRVKKTHSYEYIHAADFQFAKFFALTTEIDLRLDCAIGELCSLAASWSLGGKLNF